jgi:hyperosmotically inducible periplasmic protein
MQQMKQFMARLMVGAVLLAGIAGAASKDDGNHSDPALANKVRHEIAMYSWYTIWDNINIKVNDGNVELIGQVSQPYKKADMARLAQRVPGVKSVTNDLAVLPLSNFDDQLRIQVARAIYRDPVLSRYGIQAVPPIHIIVDNGHVTLEGVVNNDMEKNVAGIRANGAGLSFGQVVNNLRVENPSHKS